MVLESLKRNSINKISVFFAVLAMMTFTECTTPVPKDEEKQEPVADFKLTFTDRMNGQLSPEEATGNSATLKMLPASNYVEYERYRIDFIGDTASLPDTVSVTITWTPDQATRFRWGKNGTEDNGSSTVDVPRSGGTIGISGTIADTAGTFRPSIESLASTTAGTARFEANLVNTLTCTIVCE